MSADLPRRWVPLCLSVAVLLTGWLAGCGTDDSDVATVPAAQSAVSPTHPADPPSPAPLRADTRKAVERRGPEIRVVDPAVERPGVSRDRAIEIAAAEMGLSGRRPTEIALARVTNPTFATRRAPGAPTPGIGLIQDRLSWIVVFDNVLIPAPGGPIPESIGLNEHGEQPLETLLVVVDANTGQFLTGETVSRSEADKPPYRVPTGPDPLMPPGTVVRGCAATPAPGQAPASAACPGR